MGEITVSCVWQGDKYPRHYVDRLRNMVARHLPVPHRFVCFSDRPDAYWPGIDTLLTDKLDLPGWWGKMCAFLPLWPGRRLYFDLDTVIAGDLSPLAEWDGGFGICGNFTRAAGNAAYPCRYGSCVMTFPNRWGMDVWRAFREQQPELMERCERYGDQQAIEALVPEATLLQDVMPPGYFLGYRDLTERRPDGCAVVVFAGSHKPDNCAVPWIHEAWR